MAITINLRYSCKEKTNSGGSVIAPVCPVFCVNSSRQIRLPVVASSYAVEWQTE